MGGHSRRIGHAGPQVEACDHEEEDHVGSASGSAERESESPGVGQQDTVGNSGLLSRLGFLDANRDGDSGLLETAGTAVGGLLGGPLGGLVGGLAGDYLDERRARARFEAFRSAIHPVRDHAFQGWGSFDLDYLPALGLAIARVRLAFDFVDGTPAPDEDEAETTWSDEGKASFKTDFMDSVEATWSGQHQLQCTHVDPMLHDGPRWQDLKPGVVVDLIEDDASPHFTVTVSKIPEGGFARSSVGRPRRDDDGEVTRAGTATLDSEDMRPTTKRTSPEGATQRGAVHEFGHMIGLQDEYTSDPDRVGDETRQGTHRSSDRSASIMHGGEMVEQAHYRSILEALNVAVAPHGVRFDFA